MIDDVLWQNATLTGPRRNGKTTQAVELIKKRAINAEMSQFKVGIVAANRTTAIYLENYLRKEWSKVPELRFVALRTQVSTYAEYQGFSFMRTEHHARWIDGELPLLFNYEAPASSGMLHIFSVTATASQFLVDFQEYCKKDPLRSRYVHWTA